MKHKAPVLYSLVTEISSLPTKDMLRSLAAYSRDEFMQPDEFWLELIDYSPKKKYVPSAEEQLEMIRSCDYPPESIDKVFTHLI